jgi:hypothetical protein
MPNLDLQDIAQYVEQNIGSFHAKRLEKLQKLNFKEAWIQQTSATVR